MNLDLKGKTGLICGASQGIGKAVAVQLALQGCNCMLFARNEEALKKAVSELDTGSGQHHTYLTGDFSFPVKAIKSVDDFLKTSGNIEILVNNTGGPPPGLLYKTLPDSLLLAFNQHVIMSQILVGRLLPGMIEAEYGRIINIISIGAKQPIENLGVSNTVRGAMMSWSKTLSKELASFGITVNNLLPGHTSTTRLTHLMESRSKDSGKTLDQIKNEMLSHVPAGRFGEPEYPGYAAGFLALMAAGYINGVSLPVDGGFLSCF